MANIGILGGTFDPIHKAHLALGRQAYEQFHLDAVWFMPSNHPPHKKDHSVTAGEIRREMVSLAVRGIPGFVCSDFELKREGNTYTARTLTLLSEAFPGDQFYFIIGADSLYEIESWYHPEIVMSLAVLLVAVRPYEQAHPSLEQQISRLRERYGARIHKIHFHEMEVSSEEIRRAAAAGKPIDAWVPRAVIQYIEARGLYRNKQICGEEQAKWKTNIHTL